MSMRINNNLMALNTYNNLNKTSVAQEKSTEKLSSGLRINRAGDDAAGLAISEKMRGQIRGLDQAARNAQDGISMIQTAEGALSETHSILQRMRELAVEASNDTLEAADRSAIGTELQELGLEIDRISGSTQFNGKILLDGSLETTVAAGSGLQVADNLTIATGIEISEIDVSGAAANTAYTFGDGGNSVSLTATINGDTIAQTIAVSDMTVAGQSQTLDFNQLGVRLTLTWDGTGSGADSDIVDGLVAEANVTTAPSVASARFLVGANAGQIINVSFGDMSTDKLGNATDNINSLVITPAASDVVDTNTKAETLITVIDDAIEDVSIQRSQFGAAQNRLEHTISNLNTSSENTSSAESRIRDVDMAKEMMSYTKNNILQQAAQSMLAQANKSPEGVLALLQQ